MLTCVCQEPVGPLSVCIWHSIPALADGRMISALPIPMRVSLHVFIQTNSQPPVPHGLWVYAPIRACSYAAKLVVVHTMHSACAYGLTRSSGHLC